MRASPGHHGPQPGWLDMNRYPNLDPELAVPEPVLSALRDILQASGEPILPASTWVAVLREVLGTGAEPGPSTPDVADEPDATGFPGAMTPVWEHTPGSTASVQPEYPDTQYDDDHDPGPAGHLDHSIAWWWDPPAIDPQHDGAIPDHSGPGPEHIG